MGDVPGGLEESNFAGCSADGSVIVGNARTADGRIAAKWTESGGWQLLGDLPGGQTTSIAQAVSNDGSVIVGAGRAASGEMAFRCTQSGGLVALGDLSGGITQSYPADVSGDGSIVVGHSASTQGTQAFRWTQATGMVGLPDLTGGTFECRAQQMSTDGTVIVGYGRSSAGKEAVRWVNGIAIGLGDLPGGAFNSSAWAVSGDGRVIAGQATTAAGEEAFIWDSSTGMRRLKDVLVAQGVTGLENWRLTYVMGISDDGRTLTGFGVNPDGHEESFIATIALPGNASQFLAQTPPAATVVSGTSFPVSVTLRNVGDTTWTPGSKYYLGSRNPVDNLNWGGRRIAMSAGSSVAPGSQYTYSWNATAPWEPGTYNFQWKMVTLSGWFGDQTPNFVVNVTRATNAGVFVSQSGIPTTIAPGGTFTASITMKNTGTASWTTATGFKLGSWNPTNNTTWGSNRWDMPAGSNIATNGQVTFTRTFTAPTTPGTYVFQWRMIKSGVAFFGTTSTAVSIKVQ